MGIFLGVTEPRLLLRAHALNPRVSLPPALMAACHCSACSKSDELEITLAARRLADEQAAKRRRVFLDVARNLNLPPFSSFAQPPRLLDDGILPNSTGDSGLPEVSRQRSAGRWSDGGGGGGGRLPKGSKNPEKYRNDPFAPPEPLSAEQKAARKKIFKTLGLEVNDGVDSAETEDTVFAALGIRKGGRK